MIGVAILSLVLLFAFGYIFYALYSIFKEWPTIKKTWKATQPFARRAFTSGLLLFISIPALKEHPANDWYLAKVCLEIFPAIASGLFVAGLLEFFKKLHNNKD
jgi:hypothetical protein